MGSQQTMQPTTGLIRVPRNYPTTPTSGKLEALLEENYKSIYHRYSPYVDYDDGFEILRFGAKEPFIYNYIDEAKSGLSGARKYESRLFPIGSAPRDVIRIGKFLTSGDGVLFLGKQFLLQTSNAFNETRIYNPTSPIVAAGMGLTLGTVRPQRNIDLTGGLGGLVRSVIGNTIPNLFGPPTVSPPPGTTGLKALPSSNLNEGKGLLRAQTANAAQSRLTSKWAQPGGGIAPTKFLTNVFQSLFKNFIPHRQNGILVRSDEGAYGIMIGGGGTKFKYVGNTGGEFGFGQMWIAGGKSMRKKNEYPSLIYKIFNDPTGNGVVKVTNQIKTINLGGTSVQVGYSVSNSTNELKPGFRYGDSVGSSKNPDFESSEVMLQYEEFVKEENQYPNKKTDKKSVDATNASMAKVLGALRKAQTYQVSTPRDLKVISSDNPTVHGYDRLFKTTDGQAGKNPLNYPLGVLSAYRDQSITMVDNSISTDPIRKSLKLPGAGNFDAINTLRVLSGDKSIKDSKIKQWNVWNPYKDDQIAFFFHDVVNDKYVPFRSTVKGITESSTAAWEELTFVGRSDRIYSYSGFTRTLAFNFDIVISSILELAPTWARINYLMSLVKPSRYTKSAMPDGNSPVYNRFMVPPMVMVTIGDLFKIQPIIINTLSMTIPDDAAWETMNEENAEEWSYLVDYIKSDKISGAGKEFGQFPREAKISVGATLLEKQRAIVGAANFGHSPHTNDYKKEDIESYPAMHKALVEYQSETR